MLTVSVFSKLGKDEKKKSKTKKTIFLKKCRKNREKTETAFKCGLRQFVCFFNFPISTRREKNKKN